MTNTVLETGRLILRQWQTSDLAPFAKLNADSKAMRYFTNTLTPQESNTMAETCRGLIDENGWGFWATELKENNAFIGFVGLHKPKASLPCSPCVEVGWRLLPQYWGKGYATEAAKAALNFAFNKLSLKEVVAFTTLNNLPSRKVMERLGMRNTHRNFMHPDIPNNHPLQEHVLYTIKAEQYKRKE